MCALERCELLTLSKVLMLSSSAGSDSAVSSLSYHFVANRWCLCACVFPSLPGVPCVPHVRMCWTQTALDQLLPHFLATAIRLRSDAEEQHRFLFWSRVSMAVAVGKNQQGLSGCDLGVAKAPGAVGPGGGARETSPRGSNHSVGGTESEGSACDHDDELGCPQPVLLRPPVDMAPTSVAEAHILVNGVMQPLRSLPSTLARRLSCTLHTV